MFGIFGKLYTLILNVLSKLSPSIIILHDFSLDDTKTVSVIDFWLICVPHISIALMGFLVETKILLLANCFTIL